MKSRVTWVSLDETVRSYFRISALIAGNKNNMKLNLFKLLETTNCQLYCSRESIELKYWFGRPNQNVFSKYPIKCIITSAYLTLFFPLTCLLLLSLSSVINPSLSMSETLIYHSDSKLCGTVDFFSKNSKHWVSAIVPSQIAGNSDGHLIFSL